MRDSPRNRRLRTDRRALEKLRSESTILDFVSHGDPTESYLIRFYGKGLWRPEGTTDILMRDQHEVAIRLGASYPRMMPELSWKTPIFHPNISGSGVVCLGGYGTYWVPSLNLDELCSMLWDMIRYRNYDIESPYNREAAQWARTQGTYRLPLDPRFIRDKLASTPRPPSDSAIPMPSSIPLSLATTGESPAPPTPAEPTPAEPAASAPAGSSAAASSDDDVIFLDEPKVKTNVVNDSDDNDILYIE